jgi:hypothetical protein
VPECRDDHGTALGLPGNYTTSVINRPDSVLVLGMSALIKGKLKAAKDALNKGDYQLAHDTSLQVLEYEPDNYHAYVSQRARVRTPA